MLLLTVFSRSVRGCGAAFGLPDRGQILGKLRSLRLIEEDVLSPYAKAYVV